MAREPSAAVLAARQRRSAAGKARNTRIEWYIDEVASKVNMTMKQRIGLATKFLEDNIVRNISRPVTKGPGGRVTNRSKPGEFPKADTTQLMKTIFSVVHKVGDSWEGAVGTPLNYGLILETRMDRSFLKRTLDENKAQIEKILTGPIK